MGESKSVKFIGSNAKWVHKEMVDSFSVHGPCEVIIRPWSDSRSLNANAQIYVWYAQIAQHQGETNDYVKNVCKLDFGLPILLRDQVQAPRISFVLDKIGFQHWPREKQVNFMDMLNVTSLFSTKQHNEYRDTMQHELGKVGVILEYKNK